MRLRPALEAKYPDFFDAEFRLCTNQSSSKIAIETQDTKMNQFFSTLTQSNTESNPPQKTSNPSIRTPPKSSPKQEVPDLSSLAATSPPAPSTPSTFPEFNPLEFSKAAAVKTTENYQADHQHNCDRARRVRRI